MMKKLTLLGVMAGLCLQLNAQKPTVKALTVGDAVPEIIFKDLINAPIKTVKLSDFKGKLVILDFWATWCAPCVREMPKLQQLQEEFREKLTVLPINEGFSNDTRQKIAKLLRLKNITLPSAYDTGDSIGALFPHQGLPHCVMIDGQGRVLALTESRFINRDNIQNYFKGIPFTFSLKKEFNQTIVTDLASGLFQDKSVMASRLYKKIPGVYGVRQRIDSGLFKMMIFNVSLPGMYLQALEKPAYYKKRVRFENMPDSSWWLAPKTTDAALLEQWESQHFYCYENTVPLAFKKYRFEKMKQDLDYFLLYRYGIRVTVSPREVDCLLLVPYNRNSTENTAVAEKLHRYRWWQVSPSVLINALDTRVGTLPIVSGLAADAKLSVTLSINDIENFDEVLEQLHVNQLTLIPAKRTIEVVTFSKIDFDNP